MPPALPDLAAAIARRRAAHAERTALAAARWTRFQAANRQRNARKAARRPPLKLIELLARAKSPGRMLLLSLSGVWQAELEESLGSMAGPTGALAAYVAAGPDPAAQPRALFDQCWYLDHAPGLTGSAWAPLAHYLVVGDRHNLSPHPLLDAPAYRARQGARMAAGRMTALEHFLFVGAAEGIGPHPLFDVAFYVGQSETVAASGENPLVHYLRQGWREGLEPHPLFAGGWYLQANPDVAALGIAPLLHYVTAGAAEGRDPHPLFDAKGYLKQTRGRLRGGDPLSDFVLGGARELKRPNATFRPAYYLDQVGADSAARLNPLLHYLTVGTHEGFWPAPDFDEMAYFAAYPEAEAAPISALEHWTRNRTARPANAAPMGHALSAEVLFQDLRSAVADSPQIDDPGYAALRRPHRAEDGDLDALSVIALRKTAAPDWLSVARTLPNYHGHVQPRLPADGFTDPASPAALRRDVALAERYGLGGFCHEVGDAETLAALLSPDAPAFPFCLAWTGGSDAADRAAVARALTAPQALRHDGRPLLVLPGDGDPAAWRSGKLGDLFLIQRDGAPRPGFDAHLGAPPAPGAPAGPPGAVINPDFRGLAHDYLTLAQDHLARGFAPWPEIPLVVAGHDTTPQSQDAAVIWHGATPGGLQAWLQAARDAVAERPPSQRLVFLDAWNDWERGAALAPDLRYGHGWLEAIANAADADLLEP